MSGGVEYSLKRGAGSSPFPEEWGVPPGGQFSEKRAAWIQQNVAVHEIRRGPHRLARAVKRLHAIADEERRRIG